MGRDQAGARARLEHDLEQVARVEAEDGAAVGVQVADALQALGWTVREERGAPEGYPEEELWRAIRERDIAGFRAAYGEPIFIATRPE